MVATKTHPAETVEWDGDPVPVVRWGKDHWSALAYVETCVVDQGGRLDDRRLRGHLAGWEEYPTRLRGGDLLAGHNDYDCVTDAIDAGYLVPTEGRYALTPAGFEITAKLRAHKAAGGSFSSFDPTS